MILKFIFYIIVGFKMLLFIIVIPHHILTESSSQKPSQKHYTSTILRCRVLRTTLKFAHYVAKLLYSVSKKEPSSCSPMVIHGNTLDATIIMFLNGNTWECFGCNPHHVPQW